MIPKASCSAAPDERLRLTRQGLNYFGTNVKIVAVKLGLALIEQVLTMVSFSASSLIYCKIWQTIDSNILRQCHTSKNLSLQSFEFVYLRLFQDTQVIVLYSGTYLATKK